MCIQAIDWEQIPRCSTHFFNFNLRLINIYSYNDYDQEHQIGCTDFSWYLKINCILWKVGLNKDACFVVPFVIINKANKCKCFIFRGKLIPEDLFNLTCIVPLGINYQLFPIIKSIIFARTFFVCLWKNIVNTDKWSFLFLKILDPICLTKASKIDQIYFIPIKETVEEKCTESSS